LSDEQKKLQRDMKGVYTCVRYILAHYPNARSNDKLLMLLYWKMVDGIDIPRDFWYAFLHRATPPETIRRARQKIQEAGDYLPDKETLEKRRKLEEAYRRTFGGKKPNT